MSDTMTYSESAKGVRITKARAFTELRRHGLGDWATRADMLTELGDHETYLASDVLAFLGY